MSPGNLSPTEFTSGELIDQQQVNDDHLKLVLIRILGVHSVGLKILTIPSTIPPPPSPPPPTQQNSTFPPPTAHQSSVRPSVRPSIAHLFARSPTVAVVRARPSRAPSRRRLSFRPFCPLPPSPQIHNSFKCIAFPPFPNHSHSFNHSFHSFVVVVIVIPFRYSDQFVVAPLLLLLLLCWWWWIKL
ncbi:hypothetical protein niasHT_038679 [Heterodera trifolii]|uniref:Uncharacterized protein n=1 Tax=Heterodera trifolii TaxID=157864 RepID=A0ABD2I5Z1_9BILA